MPESVRHLNDCVYHLRVLLTDDAEGQDLLDQIAVKVGRKTADNGKTKPPKLENMKS